MGWGVVGACGALWARLGRNYFSPPNKAQPRILLLKNDNHMAYLTALVLLAYLRHVFTRKKKIDNPPNRW